MPLLLPWDVGGLAASGIAADVWAALMRAATHVHGDRQRVVKDDVASEDVSGHLEWLCDSVRRAALGDESPLGHLPLTTAPMRDLLDRLRQAFLEQVQIMPSPPDVGQLVRVLQAFELVQNVLGEDVGQRFANQLSGRDGLELIVEVAHDLRSPLASILFLAETLRKGQSGPITPVQERQLGLVYSAAFGLSSLASDVMELARGGDRLVEQHPVPFSISDIFQSVQDIVQPIAEEKRLQVRLSAPEADQRVGHPAALNRVLLNLTTNALKFTAEGYVEVTGKQLSRSRVEFAVRDTGRGIPPEVMGTLFETFRRRARPGDYMFSSAGLGLSICRKLVAAMGAELRVETAPDYGTRFYFELDLPPASQL